MSFSLISTLETAHDKMSETKETLNQKISKITCKIEDSDRESTKNILARATKAYEEIKKTDEGMRTVRTVTMARYNELLIEAVNTRVSDNRPTPGIETEDYGYYILALKVLFQNRRQEDPSALGGKNITDFYGILPPHGKGLNIVGDAAKENEMRDIIAKSDTVLCSLFN